MFRLRSKSCKTFMLSKNCSFNFNGVEQDSDKSKGLSTLDADALRHGHSTFFPHAVKYVKNASLSTLDPFAASVSTRFFCL